MVVTLESGHQEDKNNLANIKKDEIFEAGLFLMQQLMVTEGTVEEMGHENTETTKKTLEKEDGKQPENEATTKICKFFKTGRCKFGKDCKFSHGKVCKKYKHHGSFENGCKEGRKCPKIHVTHCSYSKRNKECPKGDNCKHKFHIRNPKYKSQQTRDPGTKKEKRFEKEDSQSFLGWGKVDQRLLYLEKQIESLTALVPMMKLMLTAPMQVNKGWDNNQSQIPSL